MLKLNLRRKKKAAWFEDEETGKKFKKSGFDVTVVGKSQDKNKSGNPVYLVCFQFLDPVQPYTRNDSESGDKKETYPLFTRVVSKNLFSRLSLSDKVTASLYMSYRGRNWYFSFPSLKNMRDYRRGIELKL
ncbi:MAG: hypothetical protein AABW58_02335 [Nanoarchaeota archaeon]